MNLSGSSRRPGGFPATKRRAPRVLVAAALGGLAVAAAVAAPGGACPTLLDRSFPRLQDEKPQDLCQYGGKVLVVVNTASYCGFTP